MLRQARHHAQVSVSLLAGMAVASSLGGCTSSRPQPAWQARAPYGASYGVPYAGAPGRPFQPGAPFPQPVAAYDRPVNAFALQSQTSGKPCAPEEMAPGVWISLDCAFQPIAKAIPLISTRSAFVGGALPPAVDLRTLGVDGPIKNQGAVGACTAFSLSTAMDIAVRKMGHQDTLAPLHVWSEYAIPNMGIAGDQTVNESITTEDRWPYDPAKACKLTRLPADSCGVAYGVVPGSGNIDPSLQSEKKRADAAGRYKVSAVEQFDKPFSADQMAAVLAGGDPIWLSVAVDTKAWKAANAQGGVIADYPSGSSNHAIVLVGYRAAGAGRQFLVHNSWGTKWGDGGYGWISDAMIARHTRAAYKVRVADVGGGGALPSPFPSPQPSSSGGCPSGQARDAVLGTCAPACASGSAPAAGVCLPSVPGFPMPQPQGGKGCAQGQGVDPMTGQCAALCPIGTPPIGGLCLPVPGH